MKGSRRPFGISPSSKKKLVLLCGAILHAVDVVVSGVVARIVVCVALCGCHASVKVCVSKFKAGTLY